MKTGNDWLLRVFERFKNHLDEWWGDIEREDPYTIGSEEAALEILRHPYTRKAYDILVRTDHGQPNKDDEERFFQSVWACTDEVNPRSRIATMVRNRLGDGQVAYLDAEINDKLFAGNRRLAHISEEATVVLRYLIGREIADSDATEIRKIEDADLIEYPHLEDKDGFITIHDPKCVDARRSPYDLYREAGLPVGNNNLWDTAMWKRKADGVEPLPILSDENIMNALQIVADYCSYYSQSRKTGADGSRADNLLGTLDEYLCPRKHLGIRRDRIYEAIGLLVRATFNDKGPRSGRTTQKVIERLRRKYREDKSPT